MAIFLLSTISASYAATDLFSAVDGLLDTGTEMVNTVTGDPENTTQNKCNCYEKTAEKKMSGGDSDITA